MVMGLVSTIALALAFGPQLQVSLQAVADDVAVQAEATAETTIETPEVSDVAPVAVEESVEATVDEALETIEDTIIAPDEMAKPQLSESEAAAEILPSETEPEIAPAPVQSGEVATAEWPEILNDASASLAAAKTARGDFAQTNPDGSVVTGTFALNRPGRMRFDYDEPTPVLIVSDGTTVAMEDTELETLDRVPIGSTPLGLILSTELNIDEDIEVLSILQNSERIGIRVSDASGELEGTLTMVFDKVSYDLLGWLTMDGNGQTTVVDLMDVETNVRIDPRLFRLNEDDDEEDER